MVLNGPSGSKSGLWAWSSNVAGVSASDATEAARVHTGQDSMPRRSEQLMMLYIAATGDRYIQLVVHLSGYKSYCHEI